MSGVLPVEGYIVPNYLFGLKLEDWRIPEEKREKECEYFNSVFGKYSSSVPKDHVDAGDMWTHSIPNYERILKDGLSS